MKWRKEKRHQEQIPTAKCAHQLKTRIYVHERKSSFAASRFEWSPSEVKGRGKGRKNVSFLKHPEYEEFLVVVVVRKSSNSGRIWRHDRTANVHGSFDAGIPDRWQTQVSRPKTRKSTKIRKKKKKKKMQFPEILSLSLSKRLRLVKVKGNNLMVRHIGRTLPFKKLHSAWLICLFQLLGIRRYTLETKRRKEIKMFLFWLFPPSEQTEAKMTALLCTHRETRRENLYIDACIFYFTRAHPFQEGKSHWPAVRYLSLPLAFDFLFGRFTQGLEPRPLCWNRIQPAHVIYIYTTCLNGVIDNHDPCYYYQDEKGNQGQHATPNHYTLFDRLKRKGEDHHHSTCSPRPFVLRGKEFRADGRFVCFKDRLNERFLFPFLPHSSTPLLCAADDVDDEDVWPRWKLGSHTHNWYSYPPFPFN